MLGIQDGKLYGLLPYGFYGSIPKQPKTKTAQTKTAHKFLTCPKRPNAGTKRLRAMTKTAHSWIRSVSCSACSLYEWRAL